MANLSGKYKRIGSFLPSFFEMSDEREPLFFFERAMSERTPFETREQNGSALLFLPRSANRAALRKNGNA